MAERTTVKGRRRSARIRRFILFLMSLGLTSEKVAVAGMGLGILAGVAFMATGEIGNAKLAWGIGGALCLMRAAAIRIDGLLQPNSVKQSREDEFYNELPERVSDAVTLLGFGFAVGSSPWLGLAAALTAIFSAYIRSLSSPRADWKKSTTPVLMTRSQRLLLLALSSLLMIVGVATRYPEFDLPRATLSIIVAGCLVTVIQRWFHLRGIKV